MLKPGCDRGSLFLQEVLNINPRHRHGLLGGAVIREGGDNGLDVWWQGREHRVEEGEEEGTREDGAVAASGLGCRQVHSHVESPEEVDTQYGPLYIPCDEVEVALVEG